MPKETGEKLIVQNKKARHDYAIEDKYEAGLALTGTEVMGRDTSIIATHPAAQSQTIRAIINADTCPPLSAGEVHFSLKPHKGLVFDRETEERVF